ncbi:TetR family transcriptional regulator [Rhodobacter sp. JA431]|uniref:Transcriptional regulator, TetR family n=1 Tax=Phaeovulum vinaykumarii TaxID=407234 RepID=A0A1N7MXU3_9RHOB|nr:MULTISPECIES: TetR family transcriptional regulator [Paracoccaceae]SIS90838.1 transcriptional regulator, TetR family [Phaeovulum vinaykumarii]SOC16029.1 TetR family transcriptional regulator [Phaeovulum vinaykumarii]SOC16283.1 TetR family transcriptional regulator [Phaeovulum vinaykumarii]SOC16336.1 TetR family transcriptional regulator [Rhodobacter sp. JA431]
MRKPSNLRRAEIIDVLLDLADRIGPDRVTTAAVAAEVGVSHGALFRHFPTKAALWQAVAEHVSELLTRAWVDALEDNPTPEGRVRALVAAQLRQIAATPALPMLLFSRELNVENAELRTAFKDRLAAYHTHLAEAVRQGQETGWLREDVVPGDAAMLLTSLVQGMAIRWVLGARDFDLEGEGCRLLAVQLRLLDRREN